MAAIEKGDGKCASKDRGNRVKGGEENHLYL
jgi:hypothetical protein